jgi:ribosomal protein S18 acetylase RimI-like enzyme
VVYFYELENKDMGFIYKLVSEQEIIKALHYPRYKYDEVIEWYNKYWKKDNDEKNFITFLDDVPVGWIKINGLKGVEKAWLSGLVISTNYHRMGIGTKGILFAEKFLKENKFTKMGIVTTNDNIKAKSLYTKCGYRINGEEIREMENGDKILNIKFEKELD